jgi:hypothetical protein
VRISEAFSRSFEDEFDSKLAEFLVEQKYLSNVEDLRSRRYFARSIIPHIKTLSDHFNRIDSDDASLDATAYWAESSNDANRRLAYFLAYAVPNAFKVASILHEISRLGLRNLNSIRSVVELGAGPAAGAAGVVLAHSRDLKIIPELSLDPDFALIEQRKSVLDLGAAFIQHLSPRASVRTFPRKIAFDRPWLPKAAPKFDLAIASFVLNESSCAPDVLASRAAEFVENHLNENGLFIIVEPALKEQSRRMLNLRQKWIERIEMNHYSQRILLPCLGHQACPALAREDDWCHEDVSWWRPKYLRMIEELTGLDRKSLPFSYLVLSKSKLGAAESFESLAPSKTLHRLVSPARSMGGSALEFFTCSAEDGKRRVRTTKAGVRGRFMQRGDIILDAEIHGAPESSQLDRLSAIVPLIDPDTDAPVD